MDLSAQMGAWAGHAGKIATFNVGEPCVWYSQIVDSDDYCENVHVGLMGCQDSEWVILLTTERIYVPGFCPGPDAITSKTYTKANTDNCPGGTFIRPDGDTDWPATITIYT